MTPVLMEFYFIYRDSAHRAKLCEYNNKEKDNSAKTLNDDDRQASSQKFRQLMAVYLLK